jgi:hypothetical protein
MSQSDKLDRWAARVATLFVLCGGGLGIACFVALTMDTLAGVV